MEFKVGDEVEVTLIIGPKKRGTIIEVTTPSWSAQQPVYKVDIGPTMTDVGPVDVPLVAYGYELSHV